MAPQPHSPRTQSPLTRGKHPAWILRVIASRLIPAHAGKTRPRPYIAAAKGAHPRSRGENGLSETRAAIGGGSSPLTRGKRHASAVGRDLLRLIPAHAGKTCTCRPCHRRPRAHPRSRGENSVKSVVAKPINGSSPLTRGKHRRSHQRRTGRRLIPVHAGKTGCRRSAREQPRAHPRSRGENCRRRWWPIPSRGSSPLTRGKRRRRQPSRALRRLIPAHAGKTCPRSVRCPQTWAHPRSRGENTGALVSTSALYGSSPLTRGKHRRTRINECVVRLIPAHAGKTPGRYFPPFR